MKAICIEAAVIDVLTLAVPAVVHAKKVCCAANLLFPFFQGAKRPRPISGLKTT